MKKRWLLVLVLVVLVFGCSQGNDITGGTVTLSEFQISACQYAAANDNCDRLQDLNLVSADNCCSTLDLCCTSVTLDKFKSALISGIASYFSDTPILSLPELKDMLSAYFSSSDVVDLNVIGQNSGEKLIYIYNKAKGYSSTPTCFDGIQNQGETGIDCGGPCPACCSPATCLSLGKSCGSWSNNCGGTVTCPSCSSGYTCSNGQCVYSCVLSCSGKCGGASDGCGGYCYGSCSPPQVCYNQACVVAQTCSSVGGSCKPNACSTYANCADLSSGQCDSGNCCSGSCTLQIPSNAIPLPLNERFYGVSFAKGSETIYVIDIPSELAVFRTEILGCCAANAGETDIRYTWIFPDGRSFYGDAMGTDNAGVIYLRSQANPFPNIPDQYIPQGKHLLKMNAYGEANIVLLYVRNW
jgi:hypothetical protein